MNDKRTFQLGDTVNIPAENRQGVITQIHTGAWTDRSGRVADEPWYQVPNECADGRPIWYVARQLEYVRNIVQEMADALRVN